MSIEKLISDLRTKYSAVSEEISSYKSAVQSLEKHLAGYDRTAAEKFRADKDLADKIELKLDSEKSELTEKLSANRRALDGLLRTFSLLSRKEKETAAAKAISDTVTGNISGREKMSLEAYVQSTYFDRIIKRANIHLMRMTNDQYELKRSVTASDKRSQTGLELDVTDHYAGADRPVRTLSGGESFKASLALALGLSDEVTSASGGIQLDCMFVDEGFGSLDDSSLEAAMDTLIGLGNSNRLVGIISHVDALKQRIDKKIIVKKDKTEGSTAYIEL